MFTDAYIPKYRQYIQAQIDKQYQTLNKDAQAAEEYAKDYRSYSWWKKLWVSKPGASDYSRMTRYYANKWIGEYKQTLARLDYEEFSNLQTHTKIPQTSYFFEWVEEQYENLGS